MTDAQVRSEHTDASDASRSSRASEGRRVLASNALASFQNTGAGERLLVENQHR